MMHWQREDRSAAVLAIIFIVGLLWMFMHPAPAAHPDEPRQTTIWTDRGQEP